ncbi:uncharacterized protein PV06_07877 [Exophiala oligosperma]|uniref:DUF7924 domain-containing protein n=1 Tax=Exophiala oligosperma TaxID=215243 RepID=A0A0D2DE14_9EURO|nr:uncharacterized protein PV06_07877 [Exophiala oligosperma]KIW40700.1 hypothetical protein PV06_07877 [Exophiala oligosperma]
MFVIDEAKSGKRRLSSQVLDDVQQEQATKKHKPSLKTRSEPQHRPPSFWDTLSKVYLSFSALKEFDSRTIQETSQQYCTFKPAAEHPQGQTLQRLKRFARRGGPDLSHIRGFASLALPVTDAMSEPSGLRGRKRSSNSSKRSKSTRTTNTTTKSRNFEQKMLDNGIYPPEYEHPDGREPVEPANLEDIQHELTTYRASLSPSRFIDDDFKAFKRANARASGEATGLYREVSDAKPDLYYGAQPSRIDQRVRADLEKYIIPSSTTSRPAAPNFFLEGKSKSGNAYEARNQAMYDGAVGARAMHKLQNFGEDESVYDNKAQSFSSTYHAGTGTLQLYATHVSRAADPGGQSEYHMTQINSYGMTGNVKTFREGAAAYRNCRDQAKSFLTDAIDQANETARRPPPKKCATEILDSSTSWSTNLIDASDTSEDELARNEVRRIKRSRPAPAQPLATSSPKARRSGRTSESLDVLDASE